MKLYRLDNPNAEMYSDIFAMLVAANSPEEAIKAAKEEYNRPWKVIEEINLDELQQATVLMYEVN